MTRRQAIKFFDWRMPQRKNFCALSDRVDLLIASSKMMRVSVQYEKINNKIPNK